MIDRVPFSGFPSRVRMYWIALWTTSIVTGVIMLVVGHPRPTITVFLVVLFALTAAVPPIANPSGGIRAPNLALWTVVAILWQPGEAGIGAGLGAFLGLVLARRSELWRASNNGSYWGLAVTVASVAAHKIIAVSPAPPSLLALGMAAAGAVVAFKLSNEGFLLCISNSIRYSRPFLAEWRAAVFRNWYSQLLSAPLAALIAAVELRLGGSVAAGVVLTGLAGLTVPLARRELEHYYRAEAQLEQIVRAVGVALDRVDPGAERHAARVRNLAVETGRVLGLPGSTLRALDLAARLHDVGDIAPAAVREDTPHAQLGAQILASFPDPAVAEMVRGHHDAFDPPVVAGRRWARLARLPLLAHAATTLLGTRILAAAETYESALAGVGEFTAPRSGAECTALLGDRAGILLDPAVVRTLLGVVHHRGDGSPAPS